MTSSEIKAKRSPGLHRRLLTGLLLLSAILVPGCKKLRPAGFWVYYQEQLLKEGKWDFGLWGGWVAMHWHAQADSTFSVKSITDFAKENGWQRVDSILVSRDAVRTWINFADPVFPFAYTNFSDYKNLDFRFPRWIDSDLVIYRYKTGWIAIQPGNTRQTDINGYVVVSSDRRQFSVYHLWGE